MCCICTSGPDREEDTIRGVDFGGCTSAWVPQELQHREIGSQASVAGFSPEAVPTPALGWWLQLSKAASLPSALVWPFPLLRPVSPPSSLGSFAEAQQQNLTRGKSHLAPKQETGGLHLAARRR